MVGKYIHPQNCAFSDLTRRVVALRMGIAISHRRKFGQVWGYTVPLSEVAGKHRGQKAPHWAFDYHTEKIVIILRCNSWAIGWSPEGTF